MNCVVVGLEGEASVDAPSINYASVEKWRHYGIIGVIAAYLVGCFWRGGHHKSFSKCKGVLVFIKCRYLYESTLNHFQNLYIGKKFGYQAQVQAPPRFETTL